MSFPKKLHGFNSGGIQRAILVVSGRRPNGRDPTRTYSLKQQGHALRATTLLNWLESFYNPGVSPISQNRKIQILKIINA